MSYMVSKATSFFWYDLETFGLNPFFDRIAQFAGQRTDLDLNPIGDPVILYCKLSADYVPDPQACLVTGITPQVVKEKGIPESEFIEKINNLLGYEGTCACGFNTLRFDDEFVRNALYRNFIDPYEREYKNHCSRWDIIDLVRACHDLRPQGIKWPSPNEKGNPVFKLTEITAANGIEQIGAHDAMVDVNATIDVARLIKQRQPKLFDYYFSLRDKVKVKNLLDTQTIPKALLHTSVNFTNPCGCTSLIVPITPHVRKEGTIVCFDLSKDPSELLNCDSKDVFRVSGVISIAANKVPFIAEEKAIKDEDYKRLGINRQVCLGHLDTILRERTALIKKIRSNSEDEFENSKDPDVGIYTKFFSDYDRNLFKTIRTTPPQMRLSLNLKFEDPRCNEMLWRHVCRNYPTVLDKENLGKWKSFAATRLLCPPLDTINNINFVTRKVEEKLEDSNLSPKDKQTLAQLKEYVISLKKFLDLK
ncbi:MAG: exodeoxyribonuclease I [Sphaerochaetaceae bacterium]|nr:exodeoxyribonuclease I [Sphaerochaetaceae bacterium]